MAVKIRLSRIGKTGHALYRVVAVDEGKSRGGKAIEILGTYDPHQKTDKLKVKTDRINYWLSVGAKASSTVDSLLK